MQRESRVRSLIWVCVCEFKISSVPNPQQASRTLVSPVSPAGSSPSPPAPRGSRSRGPWSGSRCGERGDETSPLAGGALVVSRGAARRKQNARAQRVYIRLSACV